MVDGYLQVHGIINRNITLIGLVIKIQSNEKQIINKYISALTLLRNDEHQ